MYVCYTYTYTCTQTYAYKLKQYMDCNFDKVYIMYVL